ncbi:CopG family transcriptional regulator, partial [Dysosmobacter welbionis]
SPSRWPAMCTTLPTGLYLTAFSTRLHTACRSSSAFPARVQGAASTKMVMLRASAWGAAWSA